MSADWDSSNNVMVQYSASSADCAVAAAAPGKQKMDSAGEDMEACLCPLLSESANMAVSSINSKHSSRESFP